MRITASQLRRIIKEEVRRINEGTFGDVVAAAGISTAALQKVDPGLIKLLKTPAKNVMITPPTFAGETDYTISPSTGNRNYYCPPGMGAKLQSALEKISPGSYGGPVSSGPGSGGSPGEIDISGPDVEMTSNRARFTLQWSTDVAELRSDLQKAVRWLARLSPTSKLDFSAANGLYIMSYEDAEADVEGLDVYIEWDRTPSKMAKSLNRVINFLDMNADKFMRGEVD